MTPTSNRQSILQIVAKNAVAAEIVTGCPAELSAAQCLLESGWLARMPGHNCFGIKNTDRYPDCQYVLTTEFVNGQWVKQPLAFEVYPSLRECFLDHARLITGGFDPKRPNVYAPFFADYKRDSNLYSYALNVCSKYATDSNYYIKVKKLLHDPDLIKITQLEREN